MAFGPLRVRAGASVDVPALFRAVFVHGMLYEGAAHHDGSTKRVRRPLAVGRFSKLIEVRTLNRILRVAYRLHQQNPRILKLKNPVYSAF